MIDTIDPHLDLLYMDGDRAFAHMLHTEKPSPPAEV